jgi:hypothetical protein
MSLPRILPLSPSFQKVSIWFLATVLHLIDHNVSFLSPTEEKVEEIVETQTVDKVVDEVVDVDDNKNVIDTTVAIKEDATVKATIIPKKSKSITLIDYDADQWSPDNPDGKKKYSLTQLRKLKESAPAKEKPVSIPGVLENVLIKTSTGSNHQQKDYMGHHFNMNKMMDMNLLPKFASGNSGMGGGGPNRPMAYQKRSSQQGIYFIEFHLLKHT